MPLWDSFTGHAQRVVYLAQEEARGRDTDHVGPEHLLLGLVAEADPDAVRLLARCGLSPEAIRTDLARQVKPGIARPAWDEMHLSMQGKRVIDLALEEAQRQRSSYLGSCHLLLGLIGEKKGAAGRTLDRLGADLERVRTEFIKMRTSGMLVETAEVALELREDAGEPVDRFSWLRGLAERARERMSLSISRIKGGP